ncbi:Carbamoyltransferase, hydrogen maturation protein [Candidatus Hydrogenisulfobacillus filiaventi]|uniref:Carbamoyltransferase, hydrogen maturation protein n=1 Tax=Candidatus Hydrogenisulfobacillus filiaventi TaxID=2707344 RepID=A0A6F8ZFP2_9FIRM|nr:Carbamoyltransferase, hydrogen maturation protein [Candidatus Hydrogenisulfobacillus filiaventi]
MGEQADPARVLEKIRIAEETRRSRFIGQEAITLSHGAGGKASFELIEGLIGPAFSNPLLDSLDDAAVIGLPQGLRLAFTTDSYTVSPLFFPGGNIGSLAVHGTVNDLAVSGAVPVALSAGFILEEGFSVTQLRAIVEAMALAARKIGVPIVTGDTKVVPKGKGDGIYINTAGVGIVRAVWHMGRDAVQPGDRVILSGSIGDHGVAVMIARQGLELEAEIESDTSPLHELAARLIDGVGSALHCMKDPTRGGVATTLNEVAQGSNCAIAVDEAAIPVRPEVNGACEILGLDPLTLANEGKLLAFVAPEAAEKALRILREHPLGADSVIIGEVEEGPAHMVYLRTILGGRRVLDMLVGDPLPRIC